MNNVVTVTSEELNDIITRVVSRTLAEYGYNESYCNTEDLKRAMVDRTDYECQGIPVRAVFDYYQRIFGDNLESQNDYWAKNLIESMMCDKTQHFSSDYETNMNIVAAIYAREVTKLLLGLGINSNIDVQLLAIPERDEARSIDIWKNPMIKLGNILDMTTHWNSFYFYEKGKLHTKENQLSRGNFNRLLFFDENYPNRVPHIILLTNVVSRENFGKIVEVKKQLEDIGCELLCVLALGQLAQT